MRVHALFFFPVSPPFIFRHSPPIFFTPFPSPPQQPSLFSASPSPTTIRRRLHRRCPAPHHSKTHSPFSSPSSVPTAAFQLSAFTKPTADLLLSEATLRRCRPTLPFHHSAPFYSPLHISSISEPKPPLRPAPAIFPAPPSTTTAHPPSNSTSPPGSISDQHIGLFSPQPAATSMHPTPALPTASPASSPLSTTTSQTTLLHGSLLSSTSSTPLPSPVRCPASPIRRCRPPSSPPLPTPAVTSITLSRYVPLFLLPWTAQSERDKESQPKTQSKASRGSAA